MIFLLFFVALLLSVHIILVNTIVDRATKVAYILSYDNHNIKINTVEVIKKQNTERLKDLGISISDKNNKEGYYVYDSNDLFESFKIDNKTKFYLFNKENFNLDIINNKINFISTKKDKDNKFTLIRRQEFMDLIFDKNNNPIKIPFWIQIKGNKIKSIEIVDPALLN